MKISPIQPKRHSPHTAPEDRIPLWKKALFGSGALSNGIMNSGQSLLINPVYNLTLGLNPALIGLAQAIPRIYDAFTDPLMGTLSDNHRSRFGRRRPFIAAGALLCGITFTALWLPPRGWGEQALFIYLLVALILYYSAHTIFVVPFNALGYGLTRDYHERTRLQAWQSFAVQVAAILCFWSYRFFLSEGFADVLVGIHYYGIAIGILVLITGILPGLFLEERIRPSRKSLANRRTFSKEFIEGFKGCLSNQSFLRLIATILSLVVSITISLNTLGLYIFVYYIFDGNQKAGASLWAINGTVKQLAAIVSVFGITWVATRFGKRSTMIVCLAIVMLGHLSSLILFNPKSPYLSIVSTLMIAPGLVAIWQLFWSMTADICDEDEYRHGQRREGAFGAIANWIAKFAQAIAFAVAGGVLALTGFDTALGSEQRPETLLYLRLAYALIPSLFLLGGILVFLKYPLSEEKAYEIRRILKERREAEQSSD